MADLITSDAFYQNKSNQIPNTLPPDSGHVNVFRIEDYNTAGIAPIRFNRRDFYRISLVRDKSRYHFADKSIDTEGTTLLFFNPLVPCTRERLSDDSTGFFCIFNDALFREKNPAGLHELPMFRAGGQLAYPCLVTLPTFVTVTGRGCHRGSPWAAATELSYQTN